MNEEKDHILKILQIVIFNISDCVHLFNWIEDKGIIKETLQRDLDYLIKLEEFIKKEEK